MLVALMNQMLQRVRQTRLQTACWVRMLRTVQGGVVMRQTVRKPGMLMARPLLAAVRQQQAEMQGLVITHTVDSHTSRSTCSLQSSASLKLGGSSWPSRSTRHRLPSPR